MKQQNNNSQDRILQIINEQQQQPHAHKPFMSKVPIKQTPIGFEFYQIEVPEFDLNKALKPSSQRKVIWDNKKFFPSDSVYLSSKTKEQEVLKYLTFIENYFQEKIPDYFSLVSKQRTRSLSLKLLHQCQYNYTTAKFFILFPYYRTYNRLRCHQPLILSEQQMQHKINSHLQSLKSSKQNDLMKWVKTIQNQMQSRIHISKINTYIEIAKHNKYDIPDNIKDLVEKSVKIGKQLKKNVLNSKNTLEKLESIKIQLQDHKIVTNQMIHFEEALARAQQWIKKQNKFQQEYFNPQDTEDLEKAFTLKDKQFFRQYGKIQYKLLQSLVNEYNSLPLHYPSYTKTTLLLYDYTNKWIAQIPSLSKSAKTRKSDQSSGVIKLPRKLISQILNKINQIPVQHEQFINFEYIINDGLEQLQRISMFLQDNKFEKNIKNLNMYQKLLLDIPIENDVQKKLNQKISYYELIDRIKKDISNPTKYDSLKDLLIKLKQIGYENQQHAKLQSRVLACMGWHQSQQLIKEEKKIPNKTFIILNQKAIKSKMIKYQNFEAQLLTARHQLNISEDILRQSQMRLQAVFNLRQKIMKKFQQQEPYLLDFLQVFNQCYTNGISFTQFQQLYIKLTTILILLSKMHYLLNTSQQCNQNQSLIFYFSNSQCQKIIQFICENKNSIKDLRTKQTGDEIIQTIKNINFFPKVLPQWKIFQQFMKKAQEWSDRALKIIEDFKNNDNLYNTRQVIQQSRNCLHSKQIQQQLNRIQIALKWRQKIARKMSQDNTVIFNQYDHQFMIKLQKDLQIQQMNYCSQEQMKQKALGYMYKNKKAINSMLEKISEFPLEKLIVLKLSQMNKFVKEIDREIEKYNIKDKVINQLKLQLQVELVSNQDWKQRYLAIKRFQKKKIGLSSIITNKQRNNSKRNTNNNINNNQQQEENENDISFDLMKDQKQQQIYQNYCGTGYIPKAMQIPYLPVLLSRNQQSIQIIKKKYIIKNGQFCWYFRMLLLLFQFYNGCRLKFVVEEFLKLKNTLTDVYRLIEKYNVICKKNDRTDADFEYLDTEACKVPVFFRQSYLATVKHTKILSWKNLAEPILRSVPIINMQLKARKIQELRDLIEKKKNQQMMQQHKVIQQQTNEVTNKRRRKPNQLYQNDDITLFRDDFLISKNKKRKSLSNSMSSNINSNKYSHNSTNYQSNSYQTQPYRSSSLLSKKKSQKQKQQFNNNYQHSYHKQSHTHKQTLQQLEQLMLHSQNAQFIIDDPKLYCICRNGVPNQNSLMVMCQNCQEWFHIQCIGIKKHQAKNQDNYFCVACKSLEESVYQHNLGYFWDHYKKISEYSLVYIYEEGKNIGAITHEQKKISLVYNAMIKWKEQANKLLNKILEDNPISLKPYEEEIYPLYLQSIWLPTVHYESIYLKRLMKNIRGL